MARLGSSLQCALRTVSMQRRIILLPVRKEKQKMTLQGDVNLGQVTEQQLAKILEFKLQNEGQFRFDPTTAKRQNPSVEPPTFYNVVISWSTVAGMKLVHELLESLEKV